MSASVARRQKRAQASKLTKRADFVNAVGGLAGLKPAIEDTQTAVFQILGELDNIEYEMRKQRMVFLRMVMEMKSSHHAKKTSFVITNHAAPEPKANPVEDVLALEGQYRAEYDAIFSIARGLMLKAESEANEQPNETQANN